MIRMNDENDQDDDEINDVENDQNDDEIMM